MAKIDLTKYGITGTTEIVYNPSYEVLYEEETKPELEGFEKGQESELGAVNVMTGIYTGRSPKDKFIVMDENSKDTVWWTSDEYKNDNHPASQEAWDTCKEIALKAVSYTHLDVYKRQIYPLGQQSFVFHSKENASINPLLAFPVPHICLGNGIFRLLNHKLRALSADLGICRNRGCNKGISTDDGVFPNDRLSAQNSRI